MWRTARIVLLCFLLLAIYCIEASEKAHKSGIRSKEALYSVSSLRSLHRRSGQGHLTNNHRSIAHSVLASNSMNPSRWYPLHRVEKDDDPEEARGLLEATSHSSEEEVLGAPRILLPYYTAFMFDAMAVGLVMPLLPFIVMELGADAFQLSVVISIHYLAQSIGCIVMGRVSDYYGRRVVVRLCLMASVLSYVCLSRATTLTNVILARLISASLGGLLPIMQSAVADIAEVNERPKYLGRVMAAFGLGFVLGPSLSALLVSVSTMQKIRLAGLLPMTGLLVMLVWAKETKRDASSGGGGSVGGSGKGAVVVMATTTPSRSAPTTTPTKISTVTPTRNKSPRHPTSSSAVMLLVLNGFLLMYAFATETIYAMFLKDTYGDGPETLAKLFAVNGLCIGVFQVFLIKPLINAIGKHATLVTGNLILAMAMIGVALVRERRLHFLLFVIHIVGYSIADTCVVSLITRYSSPSTQGRDLATNQAVQACARVISPLVAGFLYEHSKHSLHLPAGALPFLVGAICPAVAVVIPVLLYARSVSSKRRTAPIPMASLDESGQQVTVTRMKCMADSDDEEDN